jgi:hypothetical protein
MHSSCLGPLPISTTVVWARLRAAALSATASASSRLTGDVAMIDQHPRAPCAVPSRAFPCRASQDILRLLTLWFNHGAYEEVRVALQEGFQLVSIDTWLLVIPQIIARIHTHNTDVRQLIHHLLVKIGRHHPQVGGYRLGEGITTCAMGTLNAGQTASCSTLDVATAALRCWRTAGRQLGRLGHGTNSRCCSGSSHGKGESASC